MSIGEEHCRNLYNTQIVANEGFTQKTTASVATENCLKEGVHPTSV